MEAKNENASRGDILLERHRNSRDPNSMPSASRVNARQRTTPRRARAETGSMPDLLKTALAGTRPAIRWIWTRSDRRLDFGLSSSNAAQRDDPQTIMAKSPSTAEMMMVLRNQEQMMNELLADRSPPAEATRPRNFEPKPQPDRRNHSRLILMNDKPKIQMVLAIIALSLDQSGRRHHPGCRRLLLKNWRGKRDWEKYTRQAAARGEQLELMSRISKREQYCQTNKTFAGALIFSGLRR